LCLVDPNGCLFLHRLSPPVFSFQKVLSPTPIFSSRDPTRSNPAPVSSLLQLPLRTPNLRIRKAFLVFSLSWRGTLWLDNPSSLQGEPSPPFHDEVLSFLVAPAPCPRRPKPIHCLFIEIVLGIFSWNGSLSRGNKDPTFSLRNGTQVHLSLCHCKGRSSAANILRDMGQRGQIPPLCSQTPPFESQKGHSPPLASTEAFSWQFPALQGYTPAGRRFSDPPSTTSFSPFLAARASFVMI